MADEYDILGDFIEDFNNPITDGPVGGDMMLLLILRRAKRYYIDTPDVLIKIMRSWLVDTESGLPLRHLALFVIKQLKLTDLKKDLQLLKKHNPLSKDEIESINYAIKVI